MATDGVRIPGFVLAIAVSVVTASILGGAGAIVDTRENVARLEERTSRVEQEGIPLRALPVAIAKLEGKIDTLTDEVAKLRDQKQRR